MAEARSDLSEASAAPSELSGALAITDGTAILFAVHLILAVLAVFCAKLEAGVLTVPLWHVWWAVVWVGPAASATIWALTVTRDAKVRGIAALIPAVAYAGAFLLEQSVGRTVHSPWWLTHLLLAGVLFALVTLLGTRTRHPDQGRLMQILVTGAFVFPLLPLSADQSLCIDGWSLRIGSDVRAVFEVMESQYLIVSEDGQREVVHDQDPSTWMQYDGLSFRIARKNDAGAVGVKFADGRLVSYEFSPDDFP